MNDRSTDRLEAALRSAIAHHRSQANAARTAAESSQIPHLLLATLGFHDEIFGRPLDGATAGEILDRLRTEARRLNRLARSNSPLYDINRHIAVVEALARSPEKKDRRSVLAESDELPGSRLPGRVLNARFSNRSRRRIMTERVSLS